MSHEQVHVSPLTIKFEEDLPEGPFLVGDNQRFLLNVPAGTTNAEIQEFFLESMTRRLEEIKEAGDELQNRIAKHGNVAWEILYIHYKGENLPNDSSEVKEGYEYEVNYRMTHTAFTPESFFRIVCNIL